MNKDKIIGIEISRDEINLAVLHKNNLGQIVVVDIKNIPVINSERDKKLSDSNFYELIFKAVIELDLEGAQVVFGSRNIPFIKQVEKFSRGTAKEDIYRKISSLINSTHIFGRKLAKVSIKEAGAGINGIESVLPVAFFCISDDIITQIMDIAAGVSLKLVDIDIVQIAILRVLIHEKSLYNDYFLSVVIEDDCLDLNIVVKNKIVFTRSIAINQFGAFDEEDMQDGMLQKIKHFLIAYSNFYPKMKLPDRAVFFSRSEENKGLLKFVFDNLDSDFECELVSKISIFDPDLMKDFGSVELFRFSAAIGLALKVLEDIDVGNSFIEVSKRARKKGFDFFVKTVGFLLVFIFVLCGVGLLFVNSKIGRMEEALASPGVVHAGLSRQSGASGKSASSVGIVDEEKKNKAMLRFLELVNNIKPKEVRVSLLGMANFPQVIIKGSSNNSANIDLMFRLLKPAVSKIEVQSLEYKDDSSDILFIFNIMAN
jgi:hypothetical protein